MKKRKMRKHVLLITLLLSDPPGVAKAGYNNLKYTQNWHKGRPF